ncbi:hypothetical protein QT381_06295 [Galbitalea sp. SE-J8]|uniref:hypothetical protein n=1 Tax=Galbitalea sp. SE-J8 TaxID=3054952 RepID=UPI00259D2BE6|nr:hypothetical protein [Galbitalea sp. SE-J8]MDM4762612.1 hypothetical protein [Galbitalea sp. SE-J8]
MARKLVLLGIGLGAGYLLGTRAGREQFDRLVAVARGVWDDPRVAKARADVESYARTQAPIVKERAEAIARDLPAKVTDGAQKAAEAVATAAGRGTVVAKDVAGRTTIIAKDAAAKVTDAAHGAVSTVTGKPKSVTP